MMGLFSSGGGFFGSGGKTDSGNTSTRANNFSNTQDFNGAANVYSSVSPIYLEYGGGDGKGKSSGYGGVTLNQSDHGSIGNAFSLAQSMTNNQYSLAREQNTLLSTITSGMSLFANDAISQNSSLVDGYMGDVTSFAADMSYQNTGLISSALNDVSMFASDAISQNSNLAYNSNNNMLMMADRSLSSNEKAYGNVAEMLDMQSERNLVAAMAVHSSGIEQMQMGSELAYGLAQMNASESNNMRAQNIEEGMDIRSRGAEANLRLQENNNTTLNNGFKSMMQFADNISRSDGSQLAKSTNQTFAVLGVAAAISFFAYKKWA